ncbi:MAG: GNAT family N-acetyltransferase [Colwellia sp.]|nr:GNAT family N-acetyltransferase [Colwellia sp.]
MNIRSIQWQDALPIRHKVLWPNKPALFCKVDGDESASHYGVYIAGQLVCVASVYIKNNTARLRKFATLVEFQGDGFGTKLISHIINKLKSSGIEYFWCDARKTAMGFYRKFKMLQQGGEFNKSGVLYVKMEVQLLQLQT